MPHVDIGFLIHPGLFWWLALGAALLVGGWTYWRLAAPLRRAERILLHALRLSALLVLLLLLLEPLLTLRGGNSGRPRLAVLVDRSSSMQLPGRGAATREEEAAASLAAIEQRLGGRFALDVYGFADGLERRPAAEQGAPWKPVGATALGDALEEVLVRQGDAPLGGILVLSDGLHTAGKDPLRVARSLPVPVYTVLIGDTARPADLQLREVRAHPIGHVGEPLAVRALLEENGLAEWEASVTVREASASSRDAPGPELARRTVSFDRSGAEKEVALEVVPTRPGLTLYEVDASVPDSEAVVINNRRLVAVDVREKRTRVLVLEGEPDWDFAFLKRALDADTTLSYTYLVRQADGAFLRYGAKDPERLPARAADLAPFAAVIVSRIGPGDLPGGFPEALERYLLEGGGVLFLAASKDEGMEQWLEQGWDARVPLALVPQRRWGFLPSACLPTINGTTHEVTAIGESPAETERLWSALPPLWIQEGDYRLSPGATVLLTGKAAHPEREVPLLAIAAAGNGRVGVLAGRGFWRWDFRGGSEEAGSWVARDFWKRLARWLSEPSEQERFALRPLRPVFQDGEAVGFSARLLDAAFQPVPAARIEMTITPAGGSGAGDAASISAASGETHRLALFPEGAAGRYAGTLAPLPPGAYRYQAHAESRGGGAGNAWDASGTFWVETMGPEFYELGSSARLLGLLSAASGGASVTSAHLDELLDLLPGGVRRTPVVKQAEMWNHWAVFAFLTVVLAVEWAWRRRRGLS